MNPRDPKQKDDNVLLTKETRLQELKKIHFLKSSKVNKRIYSETPMPNLSALAFMHRYSDLRYLTSTRLSLVSIIT